MRSVKLLCTAATLLLTSCAHIYGDNGVIRNRDRDFLKAQSIAPLEIPAGYSSSTIQAHYPVSEGNYPVSTAPMSLTPPEITIAPSTPTTTSAPETSNIKTSPSLKANKPMPDYYFDRYTRSSSKAGNSIGSLFGDMNWPFTKKKPAAQPQPMSAASPKDKNNSANEQTAEEAKAEQIMQQEEEDDKQQEKKRHYFDPYSQR